MDRGLLAVLLLLSLVIHWRVWPVTTKVKWGQGVWALVWWLLKPLWYAGIGMGLSLAGWTAWHSNPWLLAMATVVLFLLSLRLRVFSETNAFKVERGAQLLPAPTQARASPLSLTLAGVALRPADETKHFKFIGTTGTGKSTAIAELLTQALSRGDRAVIADPDGGYCRHWWNPACGDVILNPFDARSVQWDPYRELRQPMDYDSLARALIPAVGRADAVWSTYARVFLSELLKRTQLVGLSSCAELMRLVQAASVVELRVLLNATPAAPFLEEGNERMFASVRSVCMSALSALQYVPASSAQGFSVRDWVSSDSRALFMPYHANEIASLRTLISTWMRLCIETTLSQTGESRPLWFVVDELDALGAIDGLKDALVRLRKHNGRCVLGFQSIGQLVGTYGEQDAKTIGENCANTLLLRSSGSGPGGTARYAQDHVGDRQVLRRYAADTQPKRWGGAQGRSVSVSWQRTIEPALLASEIEQLPDLSGFLKTASDPNWRLVTLQPPWAAAPEPAGPGA